LPTSRAIPPTNKSPSLSSEVPSPDALKLRALKIPQGIFHPTNCYVNYHSFIPQNID